jgi:hypothetical protein
MATAFSDYTSSAGGQPGPSQGEGKSDGYWSLDRLKRSYTDYLNSKVDEVEEQKNSRRYRHASQWTAEQIKIFNKRKQPIVTYNRIGRKIDGVVGLIEKLKQSPKAFPRTPKEEKGAGLATAVVRSVLDEADWKSKCPVIAENAAVDGYAGIELNLEKGDTGDPQISFEVIENDGFFYDPRSIRHDFSDCRFMGQGKWLDLDAAKELYPDHADDLEDAMESAADLSTNSDRENKWFITDGNIKRIRIIDEWYLMNGEWCWCQYTGNKKLYEGKSWLHDEKKKTFCKYIMFSAYVDQDGDRYGFVRNLKSAQDEINQRRSKGLHLLNTRRIVAEQGAFDDLEITRREASRPDGIVIRNKGFEAEFDDTAKIAELNQQMEFMVDAKAEIENFGPNPALIGQGALGDKSGRAIQLLQQAGIAELGPYLTCYRGWKIRVYRAVWNAIKEHWKTERYIRVTDDQEVLHFVGINQVGVDPMTGMPQMVNQINSLDVDIIMDEGPDSINMMADTYDALLAIAQNGSNVPPDVLIELAPGIDHDTKKRLIEKLQAPNPMMQLQMAQGQADVQKTQADTMLSKAKAMDTMRGDPGSPMEDPRITEADLRNKEADTGHKKAQTFKTMTEALLAPKEVQHEQQMDHVSARQTEEQNQHQRGMDRVSAHQNQQVTDIKAHDSYTKARQGDEAHQIAREGHQVTRESNQAKAEGAAPKKKKKKDMIADQTTAMTEAAKAQTTAVTEAARAQTTAMTEAARALAHASGMLAKAMTAKKHVVRDKRGRVSGVVSEL